MGDDDDLFLPVAWTIVNVEVVADKFRGLEEAHRRF